MSLLTIADLVRLNHGLCADCWRCRRYVDIDLEALICDGRGELPYPADTLTMHSVRGAWGHAARGAGAVPGRILVSASARRALAIRSMCGRFTHHLTWRQIVGLYRLTLDVPPDGWKARYNLAPSQAAPVVRLSPKTGGRELAMLKWGLVPFWAKEAKVGYSMINARAETVATKPAFREAFKRRRCLVPASGFYEWRAEGNGPKQPYHFCCAEGSPMTFAGLWEHWVKGETPLETFAIIVGPANEQVRPYHDRMPVILDPERWEVWLDPAAEQSALQALLQPHAGALTIQRVSRAVNNPRTDEPSLLEMAPPG